MDEKTWRKSTRSESNSGCVEVRRTLDEVRDSKNADGPHLRANVRTLVAQIRAGRLS